VPKRILVVDDNPAIRGALRRILEFNDDWTVCGEAVMAATGLKKQTSFDQIWLSWTYPCQ
jgi:DNA-binding NarL/FixJ family response regulator